MPRFYICEYNMYDVPTEQLFTRMEILANKMRLTLKQGNSGYFATTR